MVALMDLWLPIVLSAAAVWIASALAWMALPHHKGDFKSLPNEDALMRAVREQKVSPGLYGFPECGDNAKMKDPAFMAKLNEGPTGMLHVWPPGAFTKMGGKMFASFVFYLIVSTFVAYLASHSLQPGELFINVLRITGTAAIMGYCFASIPNAIWFNTPPRMVLTNLIDGIVYGLITGLLFAWLWPNIA